MSNRTPNAFHPIVREIINLLNQNNIEYEYFEHEPVRTSQEASALRTGYTITEGAKALIVKLYQKNGKDTFVMLVTPGDKRFSEDKVKKLFSITKMRFATPEELSNLTNGVQPGGVPPFGNLFGLPIYLDQSLLDNQRLIFNAGDRRVSVGMLMENYLKVVQPIIENIC